MDLIVKIIEITVLGALGVGVIICGTGMTYFGVKLFAASPRERR